MCHVANEGRTRGSINIEYDYQEEDDNEYEYNKEIYNQLKKLLILQDEIAENGEIINTYRWLTENVKKTDIFNSRIYIKNRSKESSEYGSEKFSNILITLLHAHNIEYEYPNEGTLLAALETFRTIITFNG